MGNKILIVLCFLVLMAGFVGPTHAISLGYRFTNHCDSDITIDFCTKSLLCKDFHSIPFGPETSWECTTQCPYAASVTVRYRDKDYPQVISPGTQNTWAIVCAKQSDGSYVVNIQAE
jgi:hypothetical protein